MAMKLYKNSLSVEILEYLYRSGKIPRKNLQIPFVDYAYRYYARVVHNLIEEGYITAEKYKRIIHVEISESGKKALTELYREDEEKSQQLKEEKNSATKKRQKKRKKLVVDVEALCLANGFRVRPTEKPLLSDLFGQQAETLRGEFCAAVDDGLYYSTKEIRAAYMKVLGKNEIANWTRLVGICFYKDNISFLYAVDKSLIKWMPTNESRSVEFILNFLKSSPIIPSVVSFNGHPKCIICGEGMSMIPKLVTGRKWGRTDGPESTERYRRKIAATHINAHNLNKVYGAAYYVPCGRRGIDSFKLAALITDSKRDLLSQKWFDSISTAYPVKTLRYQQGITSNDKQERVCYIPCVDLIELEFLKAQGVELHIVAPEGWQQPIARTLGPLTRSIRSLTGKLLKFEPYDEYGAPVNQKAKEKEDIKE